MYIIYDDNAKHHSKYYKTLAGVKKRINEELKTSKTCDLIGLSWNKTPVMSNAEIVRHLKKADVTLEMQKMSGYNLILRVKKIEFDD